MVVVLLPGAARADVRLEVSGSAEAVGNRLEVRVDLTNRGDAGAVAPVTVEGELFGRRDVARLERDLPPGGTSSVRLHYPLDVPRPGVHPLTLLLDYAPAGSTAAGGVAARLSQRAFLLLALGGSAEPAVRLSVPEARVETHGAVSVGIESADGAPHRVRLRVETPRGLRAENPPAEVEVPASGRVAASVGLLRAGAPRGSRQGILVVAGARDGPLERTTVVTGVVQVLPDPAYMPRLRRPLVALALVLLAGAAIVEVRRHRALARA